jgi:serine phosphatase RsbU (regulator of sigma subunit)
MVTIAPGRRGATVRRAGHPAPLLVSDTGIGKLEDGPVAPPLGVIDDARWDAHEHPLPERWSLLLYTDGLIEGRTGPGPERLGEDGLAAMVRSELAHGQDGLVKALVERAEGLNGGPLLDDVAAVLVQCRAR